MLFFLSLSSFYQKGLVEISRLENVQDNSPTPEDDMPETQEQEERTENVLSDYLESILADAVFLDLVYRQQNSYGMPFPYGWTYTEED